MRLALPFQPPGNAPRDIELINASFDEQRHELVTFDKGRAPGDCGIQTRWRYDGQRFNLTRYAQQPQCDNWQGPDAGPHYGSPVKHFAADFDNMFSGKAEEREQLVGGR